MLETSETERDRPGFWPVIGGFLDCDEILDDLARCYCLEVLRNEPLADSEWSNHSSGLILVCQDDGGGLFRRVGTYRLKKDVNEGYRSAEEVELYKTYLEEWFSSRPRVDIRIT